MEYAKAIHDLAARDEYGFWRQEFAEGLRCRYDGSGEELVRVSSEGAGITVTINPQLAATMPQSEAVIGVLVKALGEAFASTYYKAVGMLPAERDGDTKVTSGQVTDVE